MGRKYAKVTSPGVAAFIGFTAQAELTLLVNTGMSALHTLAFDLSPGGATGMQEIEFSSAELC